MVQSKLISLVLEYLWASSPDFRGPCGKRGSSLLCRLPWETSYGVQSEEAGGAGDPSAVPLSHGP